MMSRSRRAVVTGMISAPFVLRAIEARARDRLTVVMSGFDLLFWSTLTAKELGLFDQEGLDVEVVRTGGGSKSLAAIAGGNAQFSIGAPSSAFRAHVQGSDVVVIAPAIAQYTDNVTMSDAWAKAHHLTPASSYADKLKALKGMTLAVSSVGGGADQLVHFLCRQAGLDPNRDVTLTAIGSGDAMLAALMRGRIDGFVIPPPTGDDAIKNHGAHPMFTTGRGEVKPLDGFIYIGVIARQSWLNQNPDIAQRFLRAQQRGLDTIHNPATTAKARDAIRAKYQPRIDPSLFNAIWQNAAPSYPKTIALTQQMVDRIVNFVNQTQKDPLAAEKVKSAWTNAYAARALHSMGRAG